MKISAERSNFIDSVLAQLWEKAELNPCDFSLVAPLGAFVDAHRVSSFEVPDLTLGKVAEQLEKHGRSLDVADAQAPLAGFLYAEAQTAFLFVKANDSVARRRFSAAHELGHLLLHRDPDQMVFSDGVSWALSPAEEIRQDEKQEPSLTLRAPDVSPPQSGALDLERMESEANVFAARLLMPTQVCQRIWEQYGARFEAKPAFLARRLATDLLVSPLAMKIRLHELELMR